MEKFPKKKKLPYGEYVERIVSRKKKTTKRQPREEFKDEHSTAV